MSYGHGIFSGIGPPQLCHLADQQKRQRGERDKRIYELILRVPTKLAFKHSWGGPMPEKILGFGVKPQSQPTRRRHYITGKKYNAWSTLTSGQALYFLKGCCITTVMLVDYSAADRRL